MLPVHDLLIQAVAFCRGLDGVMLPCPDLADWRHAWILLRYAAWISE